MLNLNELGGFIGTERYFRHWTRVLLYTDGVHYLEENGAAWLIDAIASHQTKDLIKGDLKYFQVWKLESKDNKGLLTCRADSDQDPVVTQEIEYTDFPEGEITLFLELGSIDGVKEDRILILPSER